MYDIIQGCTHIISGMYPTEGKNLRNQIFQFKQLCCSVSRCAYLSTWITCMSDKRLHSTAAHMSYCNLGYISLGPFIGQ